jgi:cytochrome P450
MADRDGRPTTPTDVSTPAAKPSLLSEQWLPGLLARLGAGVAGLLGPIRLGDKVIVARHSDVREVLARDLDFRIAPVNGERIEAVNGPFVLGMDRGARLVRERAALYEALSAVPLTPIRHAVADEAAGRVAAAGQSIDVVDGYARPIAAGTAHRLFGIEGPDQRTFMDVARAIFAHIFLNLSGDKVVADRALRASALMRAWFDEEIQARRRSGQLGADMMGALMRLDGVDDELVRRTLGGMLVGSIDTTASSVAKIVAVIGRDKRLAARVARDVDDEARLAGWCWEALRRWPHNPIVLREAVAPTQLGDTEVAAGDRIFAWTQAAMLDSSAFPNPQELRPDRPAAAYLHFGDGLHPCAGRVVNGFQIPLLVAALVRRGVKSVGRIEWAGPFPSHVPVQFER